MNKYNDNDIRIINQSMHNLLKKIHDYINYNSEELAKLNPIDLQILEIIGNGRVRTIKEIKKTLLVSGSTLTSAINRLEKKGFLKRLINDEDKRSYGLQVTEKGVSINENHEKVDRNIAIKILNCFENEDMKVEMISILKKISDEF